MLESQASTIMSFHPGREQGLAGFESGKVWSVILAGGEGTRLRPLVRRIHPDGRPKQFAVLVGSRSLLRRTLDRSAYLVPPERTVVVTTRAHAPFFAAELWGEDPPRVIVQPSDRGTAAGVLLPVHRIAQIEPRAVVLVFPSDHYVGDDRAFMEHARALAASVTRHPQRILLAGAMPDSPETGYGWIQPGMALEKPPLGELSRVDRFIEKPTPEVAAGCMASGGLWNTFVMAAEARTLIAAGRLAMPRLHERLARIGRREGASEERAIESAYRLAPTGNFSQDVLARLTDWLAVSRLPDVAWSDWGTPDRVIESLRHEGIAPEWMRQLAGTA